MTPRLRGLPAFQALETHHRELADVHLVASGEAADREERLVLLRGESDATGRGLAETQELPQRKPKRCLVYVRLF